MHKKIVVAYSGGLTASVAIPWLKDRCAAEVIAVTLDLGQGRELNQMRDRALSAGAARCHVLDVREEFARDYLLPALQAGVLARESGPFGQDLARPLIARQLVEIARMEGATAVAHGCSGAPSDPLPFELLIRAIDKDIPIVAPARQWEMTASQLIEYARSRGMSVPPNAIDGYRAEQTLWGRSILSASLQDPWSEPPDEVFTLTKSPSHAPNSAAYVEVEWERGVPMAVNGVAMPFAELIGSLETIAGVHAVGRVDMTERTDAGVVRRVHEAPASVVLQTAHRELEGFVVPRRLLRMKQQISEEYADVIYHGEWFSPTRAALDAFVGNIQQRVTGSVRLKLYKGDCRVVGRRSPHELDGEAAVAREPVAPGVK